MADDFASYTAGLESPASDGFAITPHAANPLPETTRGIYVGGAGSVVVVLASGAELTLAGVPAGSLLPLRATHVRATSTATNLVGLL